MPSRFGSQNLHLSAPVFIVAAIPHDSTAFPALSGSTSPLNQPSPSLPTIRGKQQHPYRIPLEHLDTNSWHTIWHRIIVVCLHHLIQGIKRSTKENVARYLWPLPFEFTVSDCLWLHPYRIFSSVDGRLIWKASWCIPNAGMVVRSRSTHRKWSLGHRQAPASSLNEAGYDLYQTSTTAEPVATRAS